MPRRWTFKIQDVTSEALKDWGQRDQAIREANFRYGSIPSEIPRHLGLHHTTTWKIVIRTES